MCHPSPENSHAKAGGEAGIRTLGTGFSPYNGLANRRLQPLGHLTATRTKHTPAFQVREAGLKRLRLESPLMVQFRLHVLHQLLLCSTRKSVAAMELRTARTHVYN